MLPSKIETLTRRFTSASTSVYTTDEFYDDLNMVKDEFWNKIVASKLGQGLRWDTSLSETSVIGQSEYKLPILTINNTALKTLSGVFINYDGKTYDNGELIYNKATEVNPYTLPNAWGYYIQEQSQEKPIYYVADKSIFIAPAPTQAIANSIKVEGVFRIPDYTVDTTENEMIIPSDFHQVLLLGVIPYALMSKKATMQDIQKAQADYERKMKEALDIMSDMTSEPRTMNYPGFTTNQDPLGMEM